MIQGLILAISLLVAWTPEAMADWMGNINLVGGLKDLDQDDWSITDEHGEFGVKIDFKSEHWSKSIAFDLLYSSSGTENLVDTSSSTSLELKSTTAEANLGLRKIWSARWDRHSVVHPYIGGGASLFWAEMEQEGTLQGQSVSDSESGVGAGLWVDAGLYWTVFERYNVGVYGGFSETLLDIDLMGVDVGAGGLHYGGLVGINLQ